MTPVEYENLGKLNALYRGEIDAAISETVAGGWYILGDQLRSFEREFAAFVGTRHCIGVASGLDALVIALDCLGLPEKSEILVASNTQIATVLAVVKAGHKPVLVEPDPGTCNIDPAGIESAITNSTKAICVTHLYGKPCRMDLIMPIAGRHGLKLVEDCAQSHGARVAGSMTGALGNAGAFSFYPSKNLGALGDGGAITTDSDDFADKARCLRNYGCRAKNECIYVGYNSRLDEIQAAVLRVKLRHLEEINSHKRELAKIYRRELPAALELTAVEPDLVEVHHIFPVRHPRRDRLRAALRDRGIGTEIHYPIPPHRQQALAGMVARDFPIADRIHREIFSLPISRIHSADAVRQVCGVIKSIL